MKHSLYIQKIENMKKDKSMSLAQLNHPNNEDKKILSLNLDNLDDEELKDQVMPLSNNRNQFSNAMDRNNLSSVNLNILNNRSSNSSHISEEEQKLNLSQDHSVNKYVFYDPAVL